MNDLRAPSRRPAAFLLCCMLIGWSGMARSEAIDMESQLLRGIETTYAGDYEKASVLFQQMETRVPDHPAGIFYQATVLFWKNSLDPNNPRDDNEIQSLLERVIALSQKRLETEPDDIETLHYMGLAFTYLGRLEAHRGRLYSGGVKGETGRKYLETAMNRCPQRFPSAAHENGNAAFSCENIQFPYGAYTYFAGRLPRLLRMFNFLWFIPHGSTEEGIAALERARQNSRLHHLGATHLLATIYAYLEPGKTGKALALSTELFERFPNNPTLDLQQARFLVLNGKYGEAAEHTRSILNKIQASQPHYDDWVLNGTRLINAEIDIYEGRIDNSAATLAAIESTAAPDITSSLSPQILLLKGMIEDLRGLREQAIRYYRAVLDQSERFRNRIAEREAKQRIEQAFSPGFQKP